MTALEDARAALAEYDDWHLTQPWIEEMQGQIAYDIASTEAAALRALAAEHAALIRERDDWMDRQLVRIGLDYNESVRTELLLARAEERLERLTAPPTEDEREALAAVLGSLVYGTTFRAVRTQNADDLTDAILTSDVWRNRRQKEIPLYAMLDVWMGLYGTSHPEFDEFYAEHGYAETWAYLCAEIHNRRQGFSFCVARRDAAYREWRDARDAPDLPSYPDVFDAGWNAALEAAQAVTDGP